ncbi:histidine phosphatase family protein [Fulvivirgaceae bacterium BMA12]|uniref:Histidine phosphatase family protein n=1 Tax=Agaribacillus aureus TaxID=3051825 RepID=A0ABT8LF88_9BACT|nr:histidine phosphatase family protein [Fulvivirgaceae bacterium BMA12]
MKTLYVVRHAKSSWDFPQLSDFDRPLNKRGKRNAPDMGNRLKMRGILPDLIIASPANRALTTAKKIAKEIGYPVESIRENDQIYHSSEATLLQIIKDTPDNIQGLMLFGHNPGFTDLANFLGDQWIDNVPTCGIVAIAFDVESWTSVAPKTGKNLFFDYPKKVLL